MKKLFGLVLALLVAAALPCAVVSASPAAETAGYVELVAGESVWRYFDEKRDLFSSGWNTESYNTSDWPEGVAPFGYGAAQYTDIKTAVPCGSKAERYPAAYFKTTFTVRSALLWGEAEITYDDGAIVYLNGREVFRGRIAAGDVTYGYTSSLVDIASPETFTIAGSALKEGANDLAVAVFNNSSTSNDLYFDFRLRGATQGPPPASFGPNRLTVTYYGDTATSKAFNWYTNALSERSEVQYVEALTAEPDFSGARTIAGTVAAYGGEHIHKVLVQGLKPDTSYWYRVGDGALSMWSKPARFQTAATDGGLTFFQMNDAQGSNESEFAIWTETVRRAYEAFPEADFLSFGGDMVNDGRSEAQWGMALDMPAEYLANTSIVATSGNHDGDPKYAPPEAFTNHFYYDDQSEEPDGGAYFSLDFGGVHVTVLNANDLTEKKMSAAQLAWLEQDLAATDAAWKLVMTHKSLYTAGDHYADADIANMRQQIVPLFSRYGVDMVLAGHDHCYYRSKPMRDNAVRDDYEITETVGGNTVTYRADTDGTIYFVGNTANSSKTYPLYPDYDESVLNPAKAAAVSRAMFTVVRVDGYTLTLDAYTVDKATGRLELFDSYAAFKAVPEAIVRIASLPAVEELTLADKDRVLAADALYAKLSETDRQQVTNASLLAACKERIASLEEEERGKNESQKGCGCGAVGTGAGTISGLLIGIAAGAAVLTLAKIRLTKKELL